MQYLERMYGVNIVGTRGQRAGEGQLEGHRLAVLCSSRMLEKDETNDGELVAGLPGFVHHGFQSQF